jgi:uroporphyrinogen decarboxylase
MGALSRAPIDRIPTFEWELSKEVINALTPGEDELGFVEKMDIDGICVYPDYKNEWLDETTYRTEWGIIKKKTKEVQDIPKGGPVKEPEDLDTYQCPDPAAPWRFETLNRALTRFKDKRAVILHLNDVFSQPSRIMSFDEFLMALYTDPEMASRLIGLTVDYNIAAAQRAWNEGCRIVMTGDDVCYSLGPMFSPEQFREIFLPHYMRVMTTYHDIGFKVIKHCDGNVLPIIDMLTAPPIDCYDPMDPSAGMDIAWFKEKFGKKLCLKGNVDCAQTLTFGSMDDVVNETKRCLDIGMPGYGYICSSSNSIHSQVKPENYRAMLDTIKEYGVYR